MVAMSEADSESLGHGLLLEDVLPLQWHSLEEKAALQQVLKLHESNEEVLRFIGALDEYPSEVGDEYAVISQELARVETKLNLVLGLLGQLMTVHFPLPPSKSVKLNPVGIEWMAEETPHPGEYGLVDIYLNARCPRPLVLPGKVVHIEADQGIYRIVVKFLEMNESIQERLEKLIFRHHRRRVAMVRRRASPESEKLP